MKTESFVSIDEYLSLFPNDIQVVLTKLRTTIKEAAPDATEKISYQMPTFFLGKNLVHFAVCKNHIGFYPSPSGIEAFKNELKPYKTSKGAVQFPISQPLPFDLISQIVRFRVSENLNAANKKR